MTIITRRRVSERLERQAEARLFRALESTMKSFSYDVLKVIVAPEVFPCLEVGRGDRQGDIIRFAFWKDGSNWNN